jgi:hypothetical protein
MRQPTGDDNECQGTWYNLTSVNRGYDVEHIIESIDQGTLMYSHYQ